MNRKKLVVIMELYNEIKVYVAHLSSLKGDRRAFIIKHFIHSVGDNIGLE